MVDHVDATVVAAAAEGRVGYREGQGGGRQLRSAGRVSSRALLVGRGEVGGVHRRWARGRNRGCIHMQS